VAKLVHYSTEYPPCHGSQTPPVSRPGPGPGPGPGAQVSAIDVTETIIFERLYLVSGLRNIALFVTMPSVPTFPPLALQLFLEFRAFFSSTIRQVCDRVPVPSLR